AAGHRARRDPGGGRRRDHHRRSHPATAQRLPRHRDPGLRRDHPGHRHNLSVTGGPSGIYGIPSLSVGQVDLGAPAVFYYATVLVVALAVFGAARLGRSRLGRAWRFVREDEDAAEAMGIHTYKVKLAAYIAGAIWGGLAGVLFASQLSAISPQS